MAYCSLQSHRETPNGQPATGAACHDESRSVGWACVSILFSTTRNNECALCVYKHGRFLQIITINVHNIIHRAIPSQKKVALPAVVKYVWLIPPKIGGVAFRAWSVPACDVAMHRMCTWPFVCAFADPRHQWLCGATRRCNRVLRVLRVCTYSPFLENYPDRITFRTSSEAAGVAMQMLASAWEVSTGICFYSSSLAQEFVWVKRIQSQVVCWAWI